MIPLPNGLTCYLTSAELRRLAKFTVREIFEQRCYWRSGFELRRDDTVVDVGGNIGLFVLWAAPQIPQGRIVTIEPTRAIDCLKLNVELNRLPNVTAIQTAVGTDGGQTELVLYPGLECITHNLGLRHGWLLRRLATWVSSRSESAVEHIVSPMVSLGRILDDCQLPVVNYLKIDCEGGEYEILRNMSPTHWQRIERVAMEYHELSPDHHHEELVAILRNNGFAVEVTGTWMRHFLVKTGGIWARRSVGS